MSAITAIGSRPSPGAQLQAVPAYQATVRRGNLPANVSIGQETMTAAERVEAQHLVRLTDPHTGPWPESVINTTA